MEGAILFFSCLCAVQANNAVVKIKPLWILHLIAAVLVEGAVFQCTHEGIHVNEEKIAFSQ